MFKSVLYFGRKNCNYSKKIRKILRRNSKKFKYIESKSFGEKLTGKNISSSNFDYIICFRSFHILKKNILKKCNKIAINFHPGPPEFRGAGCVNFAIYKNSKFYGCTAHLINEKIDNGKILNVKKFSLTKNDTIETCLKKTHLYMFRQALYIIKILKKNENNLLKLIKKNKKIKWAKRLNTLKNLNKFYKINKNISKKGLFNKIRATNTKTFKPYIMLHNKKFVFTSSKEYNFKLI